MAKRGRPKPDFEAVAILLRLHPSFAEAIDKYRGEHSRSRWIEMLVKAWIVDQMPPLSPDQVRDGMARITARVKAEDAPTAPARAKTAAKPKKAAGEALVATAVGKIGPVTATPGSRLKKR
jgi:biotin carboxyl carrier protein